MWYRSKQRNLNKGISNDRETLKEILNNLNHQGKANQNFEKLS